jgi:hypothetical protein
MATRTAKKNPRHPFITGKIYVVYGYRGKEKERLGTYIAPTASRAVQDARSDASELGFSYSRVAAQKGTRADMTHEQRRAYASFMQTAPLVESRKRNPAAKAQKPRRVRIADDGREGEIVYKSAKTGWVNIRLDSGATLHAAPGTYRLINGSRGKRVVIVMKKKNSATKKPNGIFGSIGRAVKKTVQRKRALRGAKTSYRRELSIRSQIARDLRTQEAAQRAAAKAKTDREARKFERAATRAYTRALKGEAQLEKLAEKSRAAATRATLAYANPAIPVWHKAMDLADSTERATLKRASAAYARGDMSAAAVKKLASAVVARHATKKNSGYVDESGTFRPIRGTKGAESYAPTRMGRMKSRTAKDRDAHFRELKRTKGAKAAQSFLKKTAIKKTAKRQRNAADTRQYRTLRRRMKDLQGRKTGVNTQFIEAQMAKLAKLIDAEIKKMRAPSKRTNTAKRAKNLTVNIREVRVARRPKRRRNTASTDKLYSEFQGREPRGRVINGYFAPSGVPKDLSVCGPIVDLELEHGPYSKLVFNERLSNARTQPSQAQLRAALRNPEAILCQAQRGPHRRLYVTLRNPYVRLPNGEPITRTFLLGEGKAVTYVTAKPHLDDGKLHMYRHAYGDRGGSRPKFFINKAGVIDHRGGGYTVRAEGIDN